LELNVTEGKNPPGAAAATVVAAPRSAAALLRSRWPSLLGLVMIATSSFRGADLYVVTLLTMLAALIYLSAAATARRRAAWIAFAITAVIVPVGVITRLDLTIPLVVIATLLVSYGFGTLEREGWPELAIQALGFAGFTAISVIVLNLGPTVGAYSAAFGIIAHGVWDVIHHHRDKVVTRAFAEFCAVLDFGMGGLLLIVTWMTMSS
jgi:4-amino-4-deoxy-L-arabinose transferase-like glycosyltransferase